MPGGSIWPGLIALEEDDAVQGLRFLRRSQNSDPVFLAAVRCFLATLCAARPFLSSHRLFVSRLFFGGAGLPSREPLDPTGAGVSVGRGPWAFTRFGAGELGAFSTASPTKALGFLSLEVVGARLIPSCCKEVGGFLEVAMMGWLMWFNCNTEKNSMYLLPTCMKWRVRAQSKKTNSMNPWRVRVV